MRYLPELVGKGLSFSIIVEIISYNLAYMLVLSVPMSVLIATIYVFARLVQSGAYMVMKGSGVSLLQIIWPVVLIGCLVGAGMTYFNNYMLPEANYRAKNLWQDIRQKKPAFGLEEGVFNDDLNGYSIRAFGIDEEGSNLTQVTVIDDSDKNGKKTTMLAERGLMITKPEQGRIELTLTNGEIHRKSSGKQEDYERLRFGKHKMYLDISELNFQRSDNQSASRSDRTTTTPVMRTMVDSLENRVEELKAGMFAQMKRLGGDLQKEAEIKDKAVSAQSNKVTDRGSTIAVSDSTQTLLTEIEEASASVRRIKAELATTASSIKWSNNRADRYRVEIYKKYSLAIACIVFMLIGIPLGLMIKKGGIDKVAILSIGIFLFYWITLVTGEKSADRGDLEPWIGMWIANLVIGVIALFLIGRVAMGRTSLPFSVGRLTSFFSRSNEQQAP